MVYYINRSAGDIIYSLPAIKATRDQNIVIVTGLEKSLFNALVPLMAHNRVELRHSDEGVPSGAIDMENFRYYENVNKQHLCQSFIQTLQDKHVIGAELLHLVRYSDGWLRDVPEMHFTQKPYSVINVTQRYRDKVFNWNKEIGTLYQTVKTVFFIGLRSEFDIFKAKHRHWHIRYLHTENFLEAAKVISGAFSFTGTQSAMLAIAEGLGRTYRYERSPFFDNTRLGVPRETVINKNTHKIHFAYSRMQEVFRKIRAA